MFTLVQRNKADMLHGDSWHVWYVHIMNPYELIILKLTGQAKSKSPTIHFTCVAFLDCITHLFIQACPPPTMPHSFAGVRDYLHEIRMEFESLLAENAAKPEAERLPRSAFEVDPGLREMIAEVRAVYPVHMEPGQLPSCALVIGAMRSFFL